MKLQRMAIIMTALIAILTTACAMGRVQPNSISVGKVGSNLPGEMAYSYITLNGSESQVISAQAGQTLTLNYDVTVQKGSLQIEVLSPEGEIIWKKLLESDASDQTSIALDEPGRYRIVARGGNTRGNFHLSWLVE